VGKITPWLFLAAYLAKMEPPHATHQSHQVAAGGFGDSGYLSLSWSLQWEEYPRTAEYGSAVKVECLYIFPQITLLSVLLLFRRDAASNSEWSSHQTEYIKHGIYQSLESPKRSDSLPFRSFLQVSHPRERPLIHAYTRWRYNSICE
jgi:hypothetical protein